MLHSSVQPTVPDTVNEKAALSKVSDNVFTRLSGASFTDGTCNLFVRSYSWPSEGRGLLHVASRQVHSKEFKIRGASGRYCFVKKGHDISLVGDDTLMNENDSILGCINVGSGEVTLDCVLNELSKCNRNCSRSDPIDGIWEEVPSGDRGLSMTLGNTIKFGSFKIKVLDIVYSKNSANFLQLFPSKTAESVSSVASSYNASECSRSPICRICFETAGELNDYENRLVSPCLCSGSLRYIHASCLRRWLEGQLQVKQFTHGGGSYNVRTILCEICKSEYSHSVYRSILIPRPNVPHLVVEDCGNTTPATSGPSTSRIHVIPLLKDSPIRIGRSKENDLVLPDISVSRNHACIVGSFDKEGNALTVHVVDKSSKFGTLIQLPNKIALSTNQVRRVQIGPSLIEVNVALPSRLERMMPERFLPSKGVVRVVRSKEPSEAIKQAEDLKRDTRLADSPASPASPAATVNQTAIGASEEEIIDSSAHMPTTFPIDLVFLNIRYSS